MASSGSFTTTEYEGRSLTFSWSIQSQSIANNTTTISWNLKGSGSYTYGWVTCGGFKVVINGSTVYSQSTDYRVNVYSGTTVASGTHTISHNSDGSKTFSASAQAGIYTYAVNCSGSGSWALTTIPRASSFGTISGNTIGSNMTVNINRNSSSFTHQLWYKLGNSQWYDLGTGIGTSKTFTISNDLLSQLPSTTSGTLELCVRTYNGSTQIGSDVYKNVTVYVNNNVVPKVGTITITPQTYNVLIQGKNKITVSVSGCSAGVGSSIKSYTFSGPGLSTTTTSTSVTSGIISNTGTLTYTVTVTDSRGRTSSGTKTITCYAYSAPSIKSFFAFRSNSSGAKNDKGTYITCVLNNSIVYSTVGNTNNVTVKIHYKNNANSNDSKSVVAMENSTSISLQKTVGTIGTGTYSVYLTISDKYGGSSTTSIETIFGELRALNVRSSGKGIAVGKKAESEELLDVRWAIKSDEPEQTMQNLSYRGTNLISSTTNDTVANWNNQGNLATTFYTQTGQINGQPSQYGFLLNFSAGIGGKEMHNLWFQQPNGDVSHRGGNGEGLGGWRKFLDSSNYTSYASPKPTTLFSTSTGSVGTITLSQSAANFTYLEIFYTDNNGRQPNSVKIYSPNGKYVSLSCIEPSTSGTDPRIYIRTSGWTISGTSMTVGRSDLSGANRGVYGQLYPHANGTNIDVKVESQIYIKIFRVLGYN